MYFVGENKILFKDKIILGPNPKAAVGSFFLINVPVTLFAFFTVKVTKSIPNAYDIVLLGLTLGLETLIVLDVVLLIGGKLLLGESILL
jgi:hypothetical protein